MMLLFNLVEDCVYTRHANYNSLRDKPAEELQLASLLALDETVRSEENRQKNEKVEHLRQT